MLHLSIERLAALADESPTAEELEHLERCPECVRERDAHRALLALAGVERDAMRVPLTRWESISTALRKEGLITHRARGGGWGNGGFSITPRTMLQIAATLLLVAGGAALGRYSAGASPIPGGLTEAAPVQSARVILDSLPTSFASVDEAARWKAAYADAYQRTVSFLAANDSGVAPGETPAAMRARLSALDRVSRTMREALNDAPYDPVINDFYLTSFGQREATLRQLNTVLPQGVRLNSF